MLVSAYKQTVYSDTKAYMIIIGLYLIIHVIQPIVLGPQPHMHERY